ncbi:MAG: hypothetical protein M3O34_06940 [Chloroflexota bacterium]|nr:hypothetical protein [Chloroflexota bacterium]
MRGTILLQSPELAIRRALSAADRLAETGIASPARSRLVEDIERVHFFVTR